MLVKGTEAENENDAAERAEISKLSREKGRELVYEAFVEGDGVEA